jgi:plasmid stabilization system protein ParE
LIRVVTFSKTAQKNLKIILEYLDRDWSDKVVSRFKIKLDLCINTILNNPEGFPLINIKNDVRKCVVTKQTSIFYKFNSKEIQILSLFDTRQHPKKLKEIK